MENNCLLTTLNSVVENSSLKKFGEAKFFIEAGQTVTNFQFNTITSIEGDCVIKPNKQEVIVDKEYVYQHKDASYDISAVTNCTIVANKYDVTKIIFQRPAKTDLTGHDVKYMSKLTIINADFDDELKIEYLIDKPINWVYITKNCSGNINDLAYCLEISRILSTSNSNNVNGNVKTFIESQCSRGRVSGKLKLSLSPNFPFTMPNETILNSGFIYVLYNNNSALISNNEEGTDIIANYNSQTGKWS